MTSERLEQFAFDDQPCAVADTAPPVWRDAGLYRPRPQLRLALELAVQLQQPLLITGDPGCGKTTAAYWAALALGHVAEAHGEANADGRRPVALYHFQGRSDAAAARVRYEFDAVRYFRDSQIEAQRAAAAARDAKDPDLMSYVRRGPLWLAFEATGPVVILFDEIDKAPRDFPNDLLREFDRFEFDVPELSTPERTKVVRRMHRAPWLCVLTSNQERELPRAFLRRCLHHHIHLDRSDFEEILALRREREELKLSEDLYRVAFAKFWELRGAVSNKPSLAELLVWFSGLSKMGPRGLDAHTPLRKLPYLEALLKVPEDVKALHLAGEDGAGDGG